MRYEDLLLNPERSLIDMFRFILGVESLEGTFIEGYIKKLIAEK